MVEQLLHAAQLREGSGRLATASNGEEEETEQRKDVVESGVDAILLENGGVVRAVGIRVLALVVVIRSGAGGGGSLSIGLLLVSNGVESGDLLDDLLIQLLDIMGANEFRAILFERCESVSNVDERFENGQLLVWDARHARHDDSSRFAVNCNVAALEAAG